MNYTIKKQKSCEFQLTVILDKEDLNHYIKEAQKYLTNDLRIEGFRKGKVPLDIAKDKLNKEEVLKTAFDFAFKQSFVEVLIKEKIDLIDFSDFKVKENSAEKMAYVLNLIVFPEFKLPDFRQISVRKKDIKVSEKEVDQVLGFIKQSRTKFKDVDRGIEYGDKVQIDFDIRKGNEPQEIPHVLYHDFIFGKVDFYPGLNDKLKGLKKGDEKKFTLQMPSDFVKKDLASQTLKFKVKVNSVQEPEKIELNDDFARQVGKFKDIKHLRHSISDGLRMEKVQKESQRIRILILDKISQDVKMDLPKVLIEKQLDKMIAEFDYDLHQQGMELSLYLAKNNKTQDDLRKEWRSKAENLVKKSLILRKIAQVENIKVEQGELEDQVNLYIRNFPNFEGAQKNIDLEKLTDQIHQILLNEKVLAFLEKEVKYI